MANSIKDLVTSVDWKKMLSGSDARNALIGSALGGALLGGAGLMQERDPEESKFAPVGDALMGALLGGVAGYGIPKGLELFRDSGTLAPDDDVLKTNYLGWGLGGATAGTGLVGGALYKGLARTKKRLREGAEAGRVRQRNQLSRGERGARRLGDAAQVQDYTEKLTMIGDDRAAADSLLAEYRRRLWAARIGRNKAEAARLSERIRELKETRNLGFRGYRNFKGLLRHLSEESAGEPHGPLSLLTRLIPGRWRSDALPTSGFSHGAHYAPKSLFGLFDRIPASRLTRGKPVPLNSPTARLLRRGGKYAIGGAALGMLLHKLIGPGSADNYKN